ncbi:hypothetical protein M23134_07971 [Microscilla marina ATCC 23134]|uniref:Uncharacterized protein n=1 Tax=Microscilla marina ATCC 23134 TaxID=313606 RepID=A1ZWJ4_MICM2|nr:hypothetical protein M23134_07971 [Microscilla marina ATCC 23134]
MHLYFTLVVNNAQKTQLCYIIFFVTLLKDAQATSAFLFGET